MLLVEHKSRGKDAGQGTGPGHGLLPRHCRARLAADHRGVRLSARFRVHRPGQLATRANLPCRPAQARAPVRLYRRLQDAGNQGARPGQHPRRRAHGPLHDALKASGYDGHPLEVLLVRLLFCLFADDTGIFQPAQACAQFVEERTAPDGSDLGPRLAQLFQVLNTPEDKRSKTLDEQLAAFPYVNGKLFREPLPMADFTPCHARGAAGRLRAGLVGHQPGHLWQPVPEHHGQQGAPQPGRALHVGRKHPQAHRPAVSGCAAGPSSTRSKATRTAVGVSQEAAPPHVF
jgi:hypothetical protein